VEATTGDPHARCAGHPSRKLSTFLPLSADELKCLADIQSTPLKVRRGKQLADEELRAVGDPMHVETSFVRNLGDLIRVRTGTPDRLMQATAER